MSAAGAWRRIRALKREYDNSAQAVAKALGYQTRGLQMGRARMTVRNFYKIQRRFREDCLGDDFPVVTRDKIA